MPEAYELRSNTRWLSGLAALTAILLAVARPVCGETIRIENAAPDTFRYSVRQHSGAWSGRTLELGPGMRHTFRISEPLVVSYWTDTARFMTLQPGQVYRITDTQRGQLTRVVTAFKPVIEPGDPRGNGTFDANRSESSSDASAAPRTARAPAGHDVRVIKVLAVADRTYQRIVDDWQERIRKAVRGASEFYETNFGLRFVVADIQALDYRGLDNTVQERWEYLLELSPGEADLLIAFIGFGDYDLAEDGPVRVGHLGRGMHFGQHVMVSGERFVHPNRDRAVLIHELAHLFGAFHVQSPRSVMQRSIDDVPTDDIISGRLTLGPPLREVIRLARNVDFHRGVESLSPEARNRIQALCRQYRHPAEAEFPDPIETSYEYLQARREARGGPADGPDAQTGQPGSGAP
jgi:hypothetical protein